MSGIVIVGAGQAAAAMAARLRSEKYDGEITILGEEPVAPYQRPPLSKGYLLGELPLERLALRAPEFWKDQDITLKLGRRVRKINPEARTVSLGEDTLHYEQLALCTGAPPRALPTEMGGALKGVYTVRKLADVDAMQHEFCEGARLVVIGGGYIGLEAAAVARKLGVKVTLVEAASRILGRVACSQTADAIRALHQTHGTEIREGTGVQQLLGDERVNGVELVNGEVLPADFVIVGIGVIPATLLADQAGLETGNGVVTDSFGQTSCTGIWAAGDCAEIAIDGIRTRLESVGNAIDMGELVAQNMLGAGIPYQPKPWFWSDQYGSKLQIAGWNAGYDRVISRTGDGQSFWYFREERLIAVDALDDPRAYMVGKRLIEGGKDVTPAEIENPETDLKTLMRR